MKRIPNCCLNCGKYINEQCYNANNHCWRYKLVRLFDKNVHVSKAWVIG